MKNKLSSPALVDETTVVVEAVSPIKEANGVAFIVHFKGGHSYGNRMNLVDGQKNKFSAEIPLDRVGFSLMTNWGGGKNEGDKPYCLVTISGENPANSQGATTLLGRVVTVIGVGVRDSFLCEYTSY